MSFIKVDDDYRIAVRRPHSSNRLRVSPYLKVRRLMGVRQTTLASYLGISQSALSYRESYKRLYHPGELLALMAIANLTADEFVTLLRECA
jgi:predicted transcriptional regulator